MCCIMEHEVQGGERISDGESEAGKERGAEKEMRFCVSEVGHTPSNITTEESASMADREERRNLCGDCVRGLCHWGRGLRLRGSPYQKKTPHWIIA